MLDQIYFYVSEPFTEAEPRITGKDKEDLEKFKKDYPEHYEEKVKTLKIIQSFNHISPNKIKWNYESVG